MQTLMTANEYDTVSKTWTGPGNIRYYILGSVDNLAIACESCSATAITKGTEFRRGQVFTVGQYTFEMLGSGQAVIKDTASNITWQTDTFGEGAYLSYQVDGNICIYNASNVVKWCSMTNDIASSTLTIDATGQLALKNNSGVIVWTAAAIRKGARFGSMMGFTVGQYKFKMLDIGKALIADTAVPNITWQTDTFGEGAYLIYQDDGNICIYHQNTVKWCSYTQNIESSFLTISATGKLALKNSSGVIVWVAA
jgi:hypothetical protein